MQDVDDLLTALTDLLAREREALRDGALDQLEPLADEKARLLDALASLPVPETEKLQSVREAARRNHGLLEGAQNGLRAVAERMAMLRRVRNGLDLYDQRGGRTTVATRRRHVLERRA